MTYFLAKDTDKGGRICLFETKPDKISDIWYLHSAGDEFIEVSENSLPLKNRGSLITQIETKPVAVEIKIKVKEEGA